MTENQIGMADCSMRVPFFIVAPHHLHGRRLFGFQFGVLEYLF
jgi:hypothetical protein